MINLLSALFPATPDATLAAFVEPLSQVCNRYEINSINRLASFLAQTGHESGGFTRIVENLNYSVAGLRATWPKRFDAATAAHLGRTPAKKADQVGIANLVYANRMGNGPPASGDGWKFRGAGLIQLTGRSNHTAFAAAMGKSLEDSVAYIHTLEGAAMSAGWFWSTNNLNDYADKGDMLGQTRRINGGTHGLQERAALYGKARVFITKHGVK